MKELCNVMDDGDRYLYLPHNSLIIFEGYLYLPQSFSLERTIYLSID